MAVRCVLRAYTRRNLTRSKMSGAVGPRRLTAGGATTTWSREKLRAHPMGGGAVPRIPVVNVDGMRNAKHNGGTMHESKVGGLADQTAVQIFALSDAHSIKLARIAVTPACPVIICPPICVRAFARWSVSFRIWIVRNAKSRRSRIAVLLSAYRRGEFAMSGQ